MADSIRGAVIANGLAVPNVLVKIYLAGTTTLAVLFSDPAMAVSVVNDGVSGPLSEADGSYGPFYTGVGRFDIKFAKTGFSFDDSDTANILVGFGGKIRSITSGASNVQQGDSVIYCDASGGAITLTLLQVSGLTQTEIPLHIIKTDGSANTVTVQRAGTDTIQGAASVILAAQYDSLTLRAKAGGLWTAPGLTDAPVPGVIHGALADTIASNQTRYSSIAGADLFTATEAGAQTPAGFSGTIFGFYIKPASNGFGDTLVITLRKNGVDTAITVSIASASVALASDLAHSISVVPTDLLDFQLVTPAAGGTTVGPFNSVLLIRN